MAKINNPPPPGPRAPLYPWGGPRSVRERLVETGQLSKKKGKKGDPKNPPLASWALLESIGPAHSSEELRLPEPPMPGGHGADLEGFNDRPFLQTVADRGDEDVQFKLDQTLERVMASPERKDRMRALLDRESQMISVVYQMNEDIKDIQRKMRDEQAVEGV